MGIIIPAILIIISCLIIWKTSESFEIASNFLGRNLPKGLKGSTINAIASSMPELLTSLFYIFYITDENSFSGSLGVTAGSAIFNILIIPSAVIVVALINGKLHRLRISKRILLRDGLFLIIAEIILVLILRESIALNWYHGLVLICIYLIYSYLNFKIIKKDKTKNKKEYYENITFSQDKKRHLFQELIKLNLVYLIIKDGKLYSRKAWLLIITSTLIMALGSLVLVQGTEWIGKDYYDFWFFGRLKGLDIPLLFVALILSSIASSLPDTVISIRDANKGHFDDAFSNVMGSNIFDISLAIGLPLFLYTVFNEPIKMDGHIVDYGIELWVSLVLITFLSFTVFFVGRYLTIYKAFILIVLYIGFSIMILGLGLHIEPIENNVHNLFEFIRML